MKKLLSMCLALALIMCSWALASSLLEKSKDFYYNDAANVLKYEAKAEIYFNNKNLEKATGSQIVIATIRSTGSLTTDAYTDRLFNSWGVGDEKKDNGFLLLMVIASNPDDGDYWLSQGSGTGAMIDPGEIGDYLEKYLEPDFAKGNYSDGTRKIFQVMFEHVSDYYGLNLAYLTYDSIEESGILDNQDSGFTAQQENDYADFEYRVLSDGTAEITRFSGNDEILEIPSRLSKVPVTSIGDHAFAGRRSLKRITIPDSIVNIGINPFASCSNLTVINVSPKHPYLATIDGVLFSKPDRRLVCYPYAFQAKSYTIPNGIQEIGDNAFYGCGYLVNVSIPDTVKSIGEYAFYHCDYLTDLLIPDSVISIGKGAFSDCHDLTKVNIPDGITAIGEKTFSWCSSLFSISIPDSVNSIGDNAFYRCEKITDIAIPNGVKSIGGRAFSFCTSLSQITIPVSVEYIGANPFTGCEKLTSIIVSTESQYLETINGVLFSKPDKRLICYPIGYYAEKYDIPEGIQIIGENAFLGCNNLKTVSLPTSVIRIDVQAFSTCENLEGIFIPSSVQSIGDYAFNRCSNIKDIIIPDSVTSIGYSAFCYCKSLSSITIPASVTSIGDEAFIECAEFLTITVEEGSYAEEYCKSNGIKFQYPDALDWLKD